MARRAALCAVLFVLGAGARAPVRAQGADTVRVRSRLVRIAGSDLHLELLTRARLQAGDTLLLSRPGTGAGMLHVIAADSTRALVRFAGAPVPLTRGQVLELVVRVGAGVSGVPRAGADTVLQGPAPDPARRHVSDAPRSGRRGSARVSGHVSSEARWFRESGDGAAESYTVPAAALSLRVTGLPATTDVQLLGRFEHYAGDPMAVAGRSSELRIHIARVSAHPGPVRISAGRLTSEHDPASGVWDGVALAAGSRLAVAAEAGFEPMRAGGAPSSLQPRVAVSAQAAVGNPGLRYRGSVGALHYLRDVPVGRGSSALYSRQSLAAGALSLSADARLERSGSSGLELRWGGAWAALRAQGGARVHVGYRRYRPILGTDTLSALARNRVEAGVSAPLGPLNVTVSGSASPGAAERARGVSSQISLFQLPAGLDLDVYGGLFQYGALRTTHVGAAAARTAGRLFTRAGYRLERSPGRTVATAHEVDGEVAVMLGGGSSVALTVTQHDASGLSGTHAQVRLTWGF